MESPSFQDRILPAPVGGGFSMPGYWVWCGSVIQGEDGLYHMFAARWPQTLPFFNGYLVASEVVRAVSKTPQGPYHFAEVILPERGEQFWDGRMTHNPTIHRLGDKFLLFYIGATYPGARPSGESLRGENAPKDFLRATYATIRIGLATSNSVYGPWQRQVQPILEPRPGKWDGSVVTNPAPCLLKDGSILLYYRSNTPQGLRIGLARSPELGLPFERVQDDPVLRLEGDSHVEDPFVWQTAEGFQMLAKDLTGSITGEKHAGVMAVSADGIAWKVANPPKAYSRTIRWDNGSVTTQGCLERPQLLFDRVSTCMPVCRDGGWTGRLPCGEPHMEHGHSLEISV